MSPPQPPKHVAGLIASLRGTEAAVESLQAEYVCLSKHQFVRPGEKLPDDTLIEDGAVAMIRRATVTWEMMRDGRGRMEGALQRTNIRSDGSEILNDEETLSAYDGKTGRFYQTRTSANGAVLRTGRSVNNLQRTHNSPFDLTTHHLGNPISQLLADGQAAFVRDDAWEDRPVTVLQVQPVVVRDDYIYQQQFWIDAERGVVVRRESHVQRGKGMPWGLHLRIDGTKYAEAGSGLWLPGAVEQWNYVVTKAGQDFLAGHDKYAMASWTVNGAIDPARFFLDLPMGTTVIRNGEEVTEAPAPAQ